MADTHNVFIAHRHEDDALLDDLKDLLKGRGVEIRDASITSDKPNTATNPDYIKQQKLAPGIRWAGKVIVIITPDTKNHQWVDWEIEYASKQDKPIIGVWAHGSAGCEVPEPLDRFADAIVGWNADRIVQALDGDHPFEHPDGTPRGPQRIERHRC